MTFADRLKSFIKTNALLKKTAIGANNLYRRLSLLAYPGRADTVPVSPDTYEKALQHLHRLRRDHGENPPVAIASEHHTDLSIIIPVYNVAQYVAASLTSVMQQQSGFSFEIIVVNDGTTDNSMEIVDAMEKTSNVFCYTKVNGGLGDARNYGMGKARGRYVMFVDSDDLLLPGAVQSLMSEAVKADADIVQGAFTEVWNNFEKAREISMKATRSPGYRSVKITPDNKEDILRYMKGFAWGKVYKMELFRNAIFPAYNFEDTLMGLTLYHRAAKIITLSQPVYIYNRNSGSIVGNILKGNVKGLDTLYVVDYCLRLNTQLSIPFNNILYRQLLSQFGTIMYNRTFKLGDDVLQSLLVAANHTIAAYSAGRPSRLTFKERKIQQAILTCDLLLYKKAALILN